MSARTKTHASHAAVKARNFRVYVERKAPSQAATEQVPAAPDMNAVDMGVPARSIPRTLRSSGITVGGSPADRGIR